VSPHRDPEHPDEAEEVSYHVLWEEPGIVFGLVRIRLNPAGLYTEFYRPGQGWMEDARAIDAWFNGQDYEVVDEAEALRLAAAMEEGRA
jgi:hypothetical protein